MAKGKVAYKVQRINVWYPVLTRFDLSYMPPIDGPIPVPWFA